MHYPLVYVSWIQAFSYDILCSQYKKYLPESRKQFLRALENEILTELEFNQNRFFRDQGYIWFKKPISVTHSTVESHQTYYLV